MFTGNQQSTCEQCAHTPTTSLSQAPPGTYSLTARTAVSLQRGTPSTLAASPGAVLAQLSTWPYTSSATHTPMSPQPLQMHAHKGNPLQAMLQDPHQQRLGTYSWTPTCPTVALHWHSPHHHCPRSAGLCASPPAVWRYICTAYSEERVKAGDNMTGLYTCTSTYCLGARVGKRVQP